MKDQKRHLRHRDLQLQHPPWDSVEAPLPPPSPWDRANVTHPLPSGVELERLDLPFSTSDILSGYEDDVTVRNDSFTLWTRIKIEDLLALHMVDADRAAAKYREASERNLDNSSSVHHTDTHGPGRLVKQIAGKWHIITPQDATEYIDHNAFMKRFHISQYGGCAVLFNKDTFYSEIEANSIYLHDTRRGSHDQAAEGGKGWVMSGVLARATFKRRAANGQKSFTVLCLHICNIFAKKRGIAKKLILAIRAIMTSQQVDLVAGDFNGTAWRSTSEGNVTRRTIEEAFSDTNLPAPPGPTTVGAWIYS